LHRSKRLSARFFAQTLMPEATLHAAQALAGDSAEPSDEEWMAGV
jgi:hypothetical protein